MERFKKIYTFLLLGILFLAIFFRFWHISSIPPGLYPDEAINANEALTSPGKVFYPENNGREGLFINLLTFAFFIFGPSITVLRIVPAILGVLTVLGIYLFTKELFKGKQNVHLIALLSSFFVSVSFWHTNFSRIGFRAILLPFCLVFSFYFLLRGLNRLKEKELLSWSSFVISGLFFGLGFYTYIPFRLAPLILIPLFPVWLFLFRKQKGKFCLGVLCFLITAFFVALPIGLYFLDHPQDFVSRASGISIFAQENPIKAFVVSFFKHFFMFIAQGDQNWRHNHPDKTVILPILGVLLYLGLLIAKKYSLKSIKTKNLYGLIPYSFLSLWFFVMILPGALSYEGIPHSLRTIGMIPPVYIFVSLALVELMEFLQRFKPTKKLAWGFVLIVIFYAFIGNFYWYFEKWAKDPNVKGAFTNNFVQVGKYLNSLPDDPTKYVIVNEPGVPVPYPEGIPMPAQTVMFMERTKHKDLRAIYLKPEDINKIENNSIVLLMKDDDEILTKLKDKFPKGQIQKNYPIIIFTTFKLNK